VIYLRLLFSFLFLSVVNLAHSQETISVREGILDLSEWQADKYLLIEGEFEFYWRRHIVPEDYSEKDLLVSEFHDGTQNWNNYESSCGPYDPQGFATYRIHVKNKPDAELNLMLRNITCAAKVYFDSTVVAEVGQVGTKKELEVPRYQQKIIPLPHDKNDFIITIFLSNYHHRKGGFNDPMYIGTEEQLYKIDLENMLVNSLQSSAFLITGLFFFTLYIFRRRDKALLFFALYALTFFIRPMVSVDYSITSLMPFINWHLLIHIEYLSLFLPAAFLLLFIKERYQKQAPQKILLILSVIILLEAFATLVLPPELFTHLPVFHQLLSFVGFGVLLLVIFRVLRDRTSGALFAATAVACLIASSVYTILLFADMIQPSPYLYLGLQMAFLLSMSMILGSRFAAQFRKVEYLQAETLQQKEEIEVKNNEILSSIEYAERIQRAILPPSKSIEEALPDSFVFYQPKDIVAGDFYWLEQKDGKVLVAAADCTGHGVPGAMVSVICNNGLNRAVREHGLTDPGQILDKAREIVVKEFEKSEEDVKDGMDIALCSLEGKTLKYAGAYNPLWLIRNGELTEYKADKRPIGKIENPAPFTTHTVELESGDSIYMFSDGFCDQFGGAKGKKYKSANFKRFLLSIQDNDMSTQRELVQKEFDKWRGSEEQVDDVCVIGVRIN
jgi:serine phosphatase RsbU (regulator of sigma subunit)